MKLLTQNIAQNNCHFIWNAKVFVLNPYKLAYRGYSFISAGRRNSCLFILLSIFSQKDRGIASISYIKYLMD